MSELESTEKESSYTAWLETKIQRSRNESKPLIAHDQVMAQARAVIESKRKKHGCGSRKGKLS